MNRSIIISSVLHAALIFITAMSLPFLAKKPLDIPPIVSVELIQIAEKTNIPFAPKAKKIIEKKKKKKLKEKEKKLVSKLAPPKKEKKLISADAPPKKVKKTQSKTVISDDQKKEKIKNQNPDAVPPLEKEKKKIETNKEDKQNPVKTFKSDEPIKQKKDKQSPEKADNLAKQSSEFNTIIVDEDELRKIINMAKNDNIDKLKKTDEPTQDQDKSVTTGRLTLTQEQALQAQIQDCWNVPLHTKYVPEDLIVRIKLHLNPDRTIKDMEMLDRVKMNTPGKEQFRALAEGVRRAFQVEKCKILDLPTANYEKWKIIQFNFDASEMIEG